MSAKRKPLVVLAWGERGVTYGNGRTMPLPMVTLLDKCIPECWDLMRGGCVAYFMPSRQSFEALDCLVALAEELRDTQIPTLGIGLAKGDLVVERGWFGRLKPDWSSDPETVNRALAGVQGAQKYLETLNELHGQKVSSIA